MTNTADGQNLVKYTSSRHTLGPFVSVADKQGYLSITGKNMADVNFKAYCATNMPGNSTIERLVIAGIPDYSTARTEYLLAWKGLNKQYSELKSRASFMLKVIGLGCGSLFILGLVSAGFVAALGPVLLAGILGASLFSAYRDNSAELKTTLQKLNSDEQRYIIGVMTNPNITARNAAKQTVQQEIDRLQTLVRSIDNGAVTPEVALSTIKSAPAAQHIELAAEKVATPARPAVNAKSTRAARTIGNCIQA